MGAEQSLVGGGTSPEEQCVICLEQGPEEIVNNEGQVEQVPQVQICPNGHYAHLGCITPWYARTDTCPECRVNVTSFPLWREMNPDAQEYNPEFELTEFRTNHVFQRIMNENNYQNSLQYFASIVTERLMQDEERYQRLYDHFVTQRGLPISEVLIRNQPLIVEIMRNDAFNVANALNDFMIRNNIQQPNIGPIINLFRGKLRIMNWLYQHGYNVSFDFLTVAVRTIDPTSVRWYFENVNPDINQQLLLFWNQFREVYGNSNNENMRRIYDIFTQYINQQGGSMQYGGMWQRGGFFMTCS